MDWASAGVSFGTAIAAGVAAWIATSARHGSQIETVRGEASRLTSRVDEHDRRFNDLPTQFVPRLEQAQTMKDIRDSQKRTERLLLNVILHKAGLQQLPEEE